MSHYDVLGIHNSASPAEIKSAYYGKVKQLHPDHNHSASAEEDFKIVARAYETLKDPALREVYDARLKTGTQFANEATYANSTYNPYEDFYKKGRHRSNNGDDDDAFSYSTTWGENSARYKAEEQARHRYHQQTYSSSAGNEEKGIFDYLVVKIAAILTVFVVIDNWRKRQNKAKNPHGLIQAGAPMSIGQMDFETFTGWGRDDVMTPEKLHAEIKRKGFRIEYHDLSNKANDTKKPKRCCRRDKKIENLDKFLAKRNFKMQKSTYFYDSEDN